MSLVCAFVDSISATPTVRLHLSMSPWTTLASTDFGLPELKQSVAATLMGDGEYVAASAYGNRVLTLQLQVSTATVDDTATEIQRLVRELNRDRNYLKVQLDDATAPVFFRCYRSSPGGWEIPTNATRVNLTAEILAEPFAYGLQHTPVSLQTLNTNPAGGGNDCYFDVTGVDGDVETPAYIRWPVSATGTETLFAVRRRGTPSASPFLFQAEAMTQGTNTTTQANDANFSGAGNNWSRCTFTSATMQNRVSVTDLGTESVDLRGRYRVFLRYRKSTSTDDINVRIVWGDSSGFLSITNDTVTLPDTTNICMTDLGEIAIPGGVDPVYGPDGVEMSVSDAFFIGVQAERTAGAGNLDFDFILLVPADDRLAIAKFEDSPTADHWMLYAGDNSAYGQDSSNRIEAAAVIQLTGGLPMLAPNQTNRVYILRTVQSASSYTLTTVTNVSISYWPRYLTLRPATT